MKTILICTFFSLLIYLLSSIMGNSFNPFEWTNNDGKFWFCMFIFIVWVVPVFMNYLDGKPIFN